jgi:hypothetical protein
MTLLGKGIRTRKAQLNARNYEWLPYAGTLFEPDSWFFIGARNYKWLPYHTVPARNDHSENSKNGEKPFIIP